MNTITANQLKTKGVSAIESHLDDQRELVITVRGKEKFVIMNMRHYHYLRECELEAALHETRADYESGKFVSESVEKHVKRVTDSRAALK
ncbi:Antitoxin [Candidatus Desulfarcum epimagneticum]|uniref:Antitoxin n=1 Tax=uncultured Desulfobacteraceae bacterium TaxID=218296 RepID=A0A484HFI4_9BACT|nr:Antitoxin [uncultured Desulfobacteraceae bacterium]